MNKVEKNQLVELTKKYGEAFYLLNSRRFRENFCNLTNEFRKIYPNFNIAYSYKTNYIPKLCKIINEHGGYAEVVSVMELQNALRIGVQSNKIIWNGPIKNSIKAEELLINGGTINIDSEEELELVSIIADRHPNKVLNVGIRCNFDVGDGVISRFGFDVEGEPFRKALKVIKNKKNLHFINTQCHFANRDLKFWTMRINGMVEITKKIAEYIGYMPERIDVGGGMFGNMEESLKSQFSVHIPSYKEYANVVATTFLRAFPDLKTELIIEPGTALVGDCMRFLGRVESIKKIRGKIFATVLGSQKNINMSNINPPIEIISIQGNGEEYSNVDFVGYTCIEGDVIYRGYNGKLSVGDYVLISNCGSYSVVMKPPFILPNFPILDISEGETELVKRSETYDDLFASFLF